MGGALLSGGAVLVCGGLFGIRDPARRMPTRNTFRRFSSSKKLPPFPKALPSLNAGRI